MTDSLVEELRRHHQSRNWDGVLKLADLSSLDHIHDFSALIAIAEAYCCTGFPELSIPIYAKCLGFDACDLSVRSRIIDVLLSLKEWSLAADLLHDSACDAQANSRLLIARARCEANLGSPQLAESQLLSLQLEDVDRFQLGVALVEVNIKLGEVDRAESCLSRLDQLQPGSEDVVLLRLDLLAAQWVGFDVKPLLSEWLSQFSSRRRVVIRICEVYKRFCLFSDAYQLYRRASDEFGCTGMLAEGFLELLANMSKLDELREVIQSNPLIVPPRELRLLEAECLLNCDQDAKAAALLEQLPESQVSLHLLAELAKRRGDWKSALDFRRKLYVSEPLSPECQFEYAEALLSASCWYEAWPLYESRFFRKDNSQITPAGINPRNADLNPQQNNVLVFGEQGLGDTVMMASMLPDLQHVAASCTVFVQPRLAQWFTHCFPSIPVVTTIDPEKFNAMDACYGMGSLGRFFRTSSESFSGAPYLQIKDQRLLNLWAEKLSHLGDGFKVGLAWRGGRGVAAKRRSINLHQLLPMAQSNPGVVWINLQYPHSSSREELLGMKKDHGWNIHHFDGIAEDMFQTAALTQVLDLVITVQQTALHVAGSVGTKSLVLLPVGPEWRYGVRGPSMPWYSSVELFRQKHPDDWSHPLSSIQERLAALVSAFDGQNVASS